MSNHVHVPDEIEYLLEFLDSKPGLGKASLVTHLNVAHYGHERLTLEDVNTDDRVEYWLDEHDKMHQS